MIRWFKAHWQPEMIRPLCYKFFTRGVLTLFVVQLLHFFLPVDWPLARFSSLSLMAGALFVLFTWVAWLRITGLRIPQFRLPRIKRKDPPFLTGDIADHLDEDIITFDDLDEDGQNACVLAADAALAVICLLLSFVV